MPPTEDSVLIWIPARGGSVRLPGKNVQRVGGCSLLGRTVWMARELRRIAGVPARIVVDTDAKDIAAEARAWGADVPFLREREFATADSSSVDSALRFLERLEGGGEWPGEVLIVLQPTSPLRESAHLQECWARFASGDADAVVSVRRADLEHRAALGMDGRGTLSRLGHRQAGPVFCPTGAFYAVTIAALRRQRTFLPESRTRGVIARGPSSLDVDEPYQLELVRGVLERDLASGRRCTIIAEAGVNHNGDAGRALELVDAAAEAGADVVKFQTFDPAKLASAAAPKAVYQARNTGTGGSQLEMVRGLTLSLETHGELLARCRARGIRFMSSPFDEGSVDFLVRLGVDALKVPSGEITNWPMLEHCAGTGLPLIVSTGMSTLPEVADAVEVVRRAGAMDLTLLHCVSDYPASAQDANLRAMATLEVLFGTPVGWSDHTMGIAVALAAAARGAAVIEKHFTLDRELPGPDHRASLEVDELRALVGGVREVEAALGTGEKRPANSELDVASVARRSLHAARDMDAGHRIEPIDLVRLRPGTGIPPSRLHDVVGRRLLVPLSAGDLLSEEGLE